ncbi:MAG: hypothetical protein ABSD59_16105 [Terracidiphilus sp.]|jgi:hypothetical protein
MKLHGTDWAAIVAIAGAGCAAIYFALGRLMRRAVREQQRDMERQLNTMATTVKALQARVAELSGLQLAQEAKVAEISASTETAVQPEQAQTKPEIIAALTAAATTFLGKKARVRSAQSLPGAQENAGAWAQQGRVIVHTSHNPR